MLTPSTTRLPTTIAAPTTPLGMPSPPYTSTKRLATKEEVCHEFGISLNTLTEWMKDGTVPFLRYGRRVYFEWPRLLAAGRRHAQPTPDK